MTHSIPAIHGFVRASFLALAIALSGPGQLAAQISAEPAEEEFQRFHDEILDELVGAVDTRIGTLAAAESTLAPVAPSGSRSLTRRAYWLSAAWRTAMGVQFAAGPAFEFKAPRSYFLEHAQILESWIERAGSLSVDRLTDLRSGMASLRQRHAMVESALFSCYLPGIALAMRQDKVVDALLAQYQALPDDPPETKRAAWRRYDDARRAAMDGTRAMARLCLGMVASAIAAPAFTDDAVTVADGDPGTCPDHGPAIKDAKDAVTAAEKRIADLTSAIEKTRREIGQAKTRIARLEAKPENKRLKRAQAQRQGLDKLLKRYDVIIAQLDGLRATVMQQLPRGAQVFLAKGLFERAGGEAGASDDEKRAFTNVALKGNFSGEVDDSLDAAVRQAKAEATVRIAWPLASLGGLVTKIPTKSLDIIGTGLKELVFNFLSNGETDPDFIDDPKLKGFLQAAPGQFRGQSAKIAGLIRQIQSEQKRIQTLSGKDAEDAAAALVPVAVELATEAVALRETLSTQRAKLKDSAKRLDAEIAQLEAQAMGLQDELAALKDALEYLRDEFLPRQEELLAAAQKDLETRQKELRDLEQAHADSEECAK